MRRFSWLGYRRHLLSTTARQSSVDGGVWRRGLSVFSDSLIQERGIHSRSSVIRKHVDFKEFGKPLGGRYIHATGSCYFAKQDYYEILGVSENVSREEIKKAYHALAKKFHPDANKNNPSAKRKFQEIRDAYETLHNSEKKAEYDRMRAAGLEDAGYAARNTQDFRYASRNDFSDSFQKIFSEIFDDEIDQFAQDIQMELLLSFSEAAEGCTKDLTFDAYVPCDSCDGRGYPLGAKMKICPTCGGTGSVTIPPFTTTCGTCRGSGRIIKEYCMSCRGSGVVEGVKKVKVSIPAGMDSGDTIRVPGAGNISRRGSHPGDLFIKLKVADDPIFSRDGADVYVDSKISFTQAILGGKVQVPTLSGKIEVKVPKGVQPGQRLVVRGKGLPKHGFFVDHGDLFVRFVVNFPTAINERQRFILEEFAREEIENERNNFVKGNCLHFTAFMICLACQLAIVLPGYQENLFIIYSDYDKDPKMDNRLHQQLSTG
ncbi:hypothetical protein SLEP1_g42105 [Rubroshorea leprosula]|uniref:Chaperone protein dnaJ 1, mitochondrial n=1 Tax=Rubroshorea leprosula TaxID=152421 RepID=A0AAV5L8P7_9ROSI|nr:hypothetical protein SLEP1_g42105 [Rubroshorea leprosula]